MATMARAGLNGADAARLRYTNVAILLHWLIAAMIVYNLASGLLRPVLPRGFFVFHVSSGITILLLSLARVVWRLTHKPPPFLPMQRWEARAAHIVHFLLYASMLLIPLTGWALVSASPPPNSPGAAWAMAHPVARPDAAGRPAAGIPNRPAGQRPGGGGAPPRPRGPVMLWSLVPLPLIGPLNEIGRTPEGIPEQREKREQIETYHLIGGWTMLVLLILHIGGALKHQFVDRERELARMGVGRR